MSGQLSLSLSHRSIRTHVKTSFMSARRNKDASRASCRQRIRALWPKKLDPCHAPNVRDGKMLLEKFYFAPWKAGVG